MLTFAHPQFPVLWRMQGQYLFISLQTYTMMNRIVRIGCLMMGVLWCCSLPAQTIDLLFAGDLMQHQGQIDAARTGGTYNYDSCFAKVSPEIKRADLAVANLEVTLAGPPYKGYPQFSAPDEYLKAIKDAGFDVLVTANNHCLDGGKKGLKRTIQMLDSLRIPYAGTYVNEAERARCYPLLVEKKGMRIVFLNYTYGTNGLKVQPPQVVNYIDTVQISKDIEAAKRMKPDAIIALMHWGLEYHSLPERSERQLAAWLISRGVDHIIGSHPHVVQPVEVVRDETEQGNRHLVVYSLGNYISNMSKVDTDGGMMVRLQLTKKDGHTYMSHCGYSLVWVSRPVLSGKKNYELYPAANPPKHLTPAEKVRLDRFTENARKLFQKHNIGIEEYSF